MRKQNKLYTANRWNQPLFAQGVDRENYNIFDGENGSFLNTGGIGQSNFGMGNSLIAGLKSHLQLGIKDPDLRNNINSTVANSGFNPLVSWGIGGSTNQENPNTVDPFGIQKDFKNRTNSIVKKAQGIVDTAKSFVPKTVPTVSSRIARLAEADRLANPWNYTLDGGSTVSQYLNSTNKLGISKANNPFSKANTGNTAATAAMVAAPIANSLISDGFSTKEGEALAGLGNAVAAGLAATGVGAVPAAIVSVASNLVGGVLNRGGGVKWNNKGKAIVEGTTQALNSSANSLASQNTNEGIMDAWGQTDFGTEFSKGDIGKDGWWGHKAKKEYRRQKQLRKEAQERARRGFTLGVENADSTMDDLAQSNFIYADGGFLDNIDLNNMGAVDFNFMSDYLLQKDRQNSLKNKMSGIPSTPTINSFAIGGYKGKGEGFTGGGSSYKWKKGDSFRKAKNFNEAFDMAVAANMPEFIFNGRRYNTQKENNPVREYNNRWVGQGRRYNEKDTSEAYDRQAGPIGGPMSLIPMVTNTYNPNEDVPELEYNPNAMDTFYSPFRSYATQAPKHIVPGVHKRSNGGFLDNIFAIGGDLQTNGADWSTGLTYVNEGGSHEENPNEGVQMGVDREGTPNLVEQGETVFNDYVYSTRILIDDETKRKFHIGKKREMSYADLSKKLEKESSERPNDPISQAALKAQMAQLAEEQERQKAEMQEAQAQEAFASLSPEEKQALLAEAAARRQQGAEEQQMAEQAMQEQADMQEPSPEEAAMAQQQMMADGSGPSLGIEPEGYAYGGKVNRFDDGGTLKQKIYNALKLLTDKDFDKWAKDNNIGDVDWDNILKNQAFIDALSKDNAALKHVLGSGYDFGVFTPGADGKINFDDDRGNWDAQTVAGWWGSEDPAWKEVIKAHPELTKDTVLTREQLADYLRNTDAFKKGTKWLEDSEDNRLTYLQRIINNPKAPKKAVEYARKFVDENGWRKDAARDYNTIFNNPSGRAANPGTYWKTPIEAVRDKIAKNFVINDDGTVEEMAVDVPDGWKATNTYNWSTPEHDMTYNYFKRPVDGDSPADSTKDKGTEDEWEVTPNYKNENLRYAGLFGPAVGLGLMAAGVGKPKTGLLDASLEILNNGPALATYKPIGDYIKYRPMDIWYNQNRMDANARATDRALINNSAPVSTRAAGLLANSYNSQLGSGELYRQALEYNDNLRKQVADFNRGTNQFNAEAFNRTSLQNAEMINRQNQLRAQMAAQVADEKMAADAGWYNSMYGNVGNLFKGISDLGKENAQHNMIAEMAANELFGPMSPRTSVGRRGKYLTFTKKENAKGGKLNNRRK